MLSKVSQFACGGANLAPQGCVQYFYGKNSGTVRSFNYNSRNGLHLADQKQSICVRCTSVSMINLNISRVFSIALYRRERANCR